MVDDDDDDDDVHLFVKPPIFNYLRGSTTKWYQSLCNVKLLSASGNLQQRWEPKVCHTTDLLVKNNVWQKRT